ncbi:MAG: translation elongation factor Ts [Candidatus Komeilibacteria bacterium]
MSLELIKKIRTLTGAGMMDVQKALAEAGNDEQKAIDLLRERGQKMAAKRSDRETKEGVIALAKGQGKLAWAYLTCETDFVALNADFIQAVQDFADQALSQGADSVNANAPEKVNKELILKIGENIQFGGVASFSGAVIGSYLHGNRKVAAVVILEFGSQEVANDIAMQAAAMRPDYLQPADVPADIVAKEKEVYRKQLETEGKPAAMIEKILPGKLDKYYSEVCLIKQKFIKDDKLTVEQYLQNNQAAIVSFKYLAL